MKSPHTEPPAPATHGAHTSTHTPRAALTPAKPEYLLRLPLVVARVGLQKTAIYAAMRTNPPTFPLSVRIHARAVGWKESEIDAWIASRAQTGAQS